MVTINFFYKSRVNW